MHYTRSLCIAAGLVALLHLSGCGIPVPADKADYVGEWEGDTISLEISANGSVDYERKQGAFTKSVSAPIQGFHGDDFTIGLFGLTTTFKVEQPPSEINGIWAMKVDGEQLIRADPETQQRVEEYLQSTKAAASSFLDLVDSGAVESAWDRLTEDVREEYTFEAWSQSLARINDIFGGVRDRELLQTSFAQASGTHGAIQLFSFASSVTSHSGETGTEIVAIRLDENGQWAVNRYTVRPDDEQLFSAPVQHASSAPADAPQGSSRASSQTPPARYRREYVEMSVPALAGYLRQPVRIQTTDGVQHSGYLLASSQDRITVRQRRRGGSFDFEIRHPRIAKAEVMRQVRY